jgi:hypothetical protein
VDWRGRRETPGQQKCAGETFRDKALVVHCVFNSLDA